MSDSLWNLDFRPIYFDKLISVRPRHLVVEAQGVNQLVLDHSLPPTVRAGQLHSVWAVAGAMETNLGPDRSTPPLLLFQVRDQV